MLTLEDRFQLYPLSDRHLHAGRRLIDHGLRLASPAVQFARRDHFHYS